MKLSKTLVTLSLASIAVISLLFVINLNSQHIQLIEEKGDPSVLDNIQMYGVYEDIQSNEGAYFKEFYYTKEKMFRPPVKNFNFAQAVLDQKTLLERNDLKEFQFQFEQDLSLNWTYDYKHPNNRRIIYKINKDDNLSQSYYLDLKLNESVISGAYQSGKVYLLLSNQATDNEEWRGFEQITISSDTGQVESRKQLKFKLKLDQLYPENPVVGNSAYFYVYTQDKVTEGLYQTTRNSYLYRINPIDGEVTEIPAKSWEEDNILLFAENQDLYSMRRDGLFTYNSKKNSFVKLSVLPSEDYRNATYQDGNLYLSYVKGKETYLKVYQFKDLTEIYSVKIDFPEQAGLGFIQFD